MPTTDPITSSASWFAWKTCRRTWSTRSSPSRISASSTTGGIDVRRIVGALWVNLRSGRVRQGGSTLTQQLVKNFFLTPERSLKRKLQEAAMALIVEARYEKEAILESYLNEIYLGQRGSTAIHGVGEASWFYFGKAAHHISLPESALIAAIIQSPARPLSAP